MCVCCVGGGEVALHVLVVHVVPSLRVVSVICRSGAYGSGIYLTSSLEKVASVAMGNGGAWESGALECVERLCEEVVLLEVLMGCGRVVVQGVCKE